MQKRSKFSQVSMIAVSIVLLTSSLVLANLEIQTNMENAVQTIRKVIVTDNGTVKLLNLSLMQHQPRVGILKQICFLKPKKFIFSKFPVNRYGKLQTFIFIKNCTFKNHFFCN